MGFAPHHLPKHPFLLVRNHRSRPICPATNRAAPACPRQARCRARPGSRAPITNARRNRRTPWLPAHASSQSDRVTCHWHVPCRSSLPLPASRFPPPCGEGEGGGRPGPAVATRPLHKPDASPTASRRARTHGARLEPLCKRRNRHLSERIHLTPPTMPEDSGISHRPQLIHKENQRVIPR